MGYIGRPVYRGYTKLLDSHKINLSGDATGNTSFDGTQDVTIPLTFSSNPTFSGNVGIGVTPSAWGSTYKATQLTYGSLYSAAYTILGMSVGAYNDNTNWKYVQTGQLVSRYEQTAGQHQWLIAGAGTAGNPISFTQAMTLDASGNLGIGTTSPAAKLDVNGNVNISTSGNLFLSNTSGIFFNGNNSFATGIYNDASGILRFATNGSDRMRLDSNGNLGLGTSSPGTKLDVVGGNITVDGFTGSYGLCFRRGFENSGNLRIYAGEVGATGRWGGLRLSAYDGIAFGVQSNSWNEVARFDMNGNLGIGTVPTTNGSVAVLQVGGGNISSIGAYGWGQAFSTRFVMGPGTQSSSNGNAKMWATRVDRAASDTPSKYVVSTYTGYDSSTPGSYIPTTGWVDMLTIDASGNLGLGVTPSANWSGVTALQLNAAGSISSTNLYTAMQNGLVATSPGYAWKYLTSSYGLAYVQSNTNGQHQWYIAASGAAGAVASPTQAMTLDASGNLLLGTTAKIGTGAQLQISGCNNIGGTNLHTYAAIKNSAVNKTKYFRVDDGGNWNVINDAYSTVLFSVADVGGVFASAYNGAGTGLTGYAAGLSVGGSAAATYPPYQAAMGKGLNTWNQMAGNGVVCIRALGSYMNSLSIYAGIAAAGGYARIGGFGDDLNSNTKEVSFSFPLRAGYWYFIESPSLYVSSTWAWGYETFTITEYYG